MRVHIVHDDSGRLIAVSRVMSRADLESSGSAFIKAGPVPGPGQHVVETDVSDELVDRGLRAVLDGYRWDISGTALVEHDDQ